MVKIKFPKKEGPEDLEGLLSLIFWKNPRLVSHASEFMGHIKEWERSEKPYRVDEWQNYCTRKGISQSTYHNILKKLKDSGMIEKRYNKNRQIHELHISARFSEVLNDLSVVWDRYKMQ